MSVIAWNLLRFLKNLSIGNVWQRKLPLAGEFASICRLSSESTAWNQLYVDARTPERFNYAETSCGTLLRAWEKSTMTKSVCFPLSGWSELTSVRGAKSCFSHLRRARKPRWRSVRILRWLRCRMPLLEMMCSWILRRTMVSETCLYFGAQFRSPFLNYRRQYRSLPVILGGSCLWRVVE